MIDIMSSLDYYNLAEAFFRFQKAAKKYAFYSEEIQKMEQSIREMDPLQNDPKTITEDMERAKNYESI